MQRRQFLFGLAASALLSACGSLPQSSDPTPTTPRRKPRVGLALGGGAAKGFAHVGVIKILEAQGIFPDIITGTSAGSVVGALYAAGYSGVQLQELSFALDESRFRDFSIGNGGLIRGQKLEDYVNQQLKKRPIEKLKRPFAAVATDLDSGRKVIFQRGNTGQAVRASSSVPGVFEPVLIQGRRYVDGGLVSPVPVDAARDLGADIVIAVDISSKANNGKPDGTLSILEQTFTIMGQKIGESELSKADVVLRPAVGTMGSTEFERKHSAILEGEKAALAALPLIRQKLGLPRR